eukprot:m.360113 g.360113  ORF g.360113 m.360113 type:complete len:742 (-) comp18898_c0_seq1:428-2653(-)
MSTTDIVKQGWLVKSPPAGVMKGWKKRFFRLKRKSATGNARLEYFADEKATARGASKGVIDLSTCSAVEPGTPEPEKAKYIFKVITSSRIYTLQAQAQIEMQGWIDAICGELFQPAASQQPPQPQPSIRRPAPSLRASTRTAPASAPPPRQSFSSKSKPTFLTKGPRGKPHHPQPLAGPFEWLYGQISRQEAEGVLNDYGMESGLFLVRESSKPGAHAISVCSNGKIVHHLVTRSTLGVFQLNGVACGDCASLDEVVEYLESPRPGPPLNWRGSLRIYPKAFDAQFTGGAADTPPALPPPRTPKSDPAQPPIVEFERTFSATVKALHAALTVGIVEDTKCLVRITNTHIIMIDSQTRHEKFNWPLASITEYGNEGQIAFFKTTSNPTGLFCFETALALDITNALKGNVGHGPNGQLPTSAPSIPARATSMRAPPTKPANAQFSSLRSPPPVAARPSNPVVPDTAEEVGDYEEPWDNDEDASVPDSAKPLPPPIGPKPTGKTFDKINLDKMNSIVGEQARLAQTGAPPVVMRKKAAAPEPSAEETVAPVSTGRSHEALGVALPKVDQDGLAKALGGLRKSQIFDEAQVPDFSDAATIPAAITEEESDMPMPTEAPPATPQADSSPRPALMSQDKVVQDETLESEVSTERWLAACDYVPGADSIDRLGFEEGDVLLVVSKDDGGWWFAQLGDNEGWVPSDFLDPYPEEDLGPAEDVSRRMSTDDLVAAALRIASTVEQSFAEA